MLIKSFDEFFTKFEDTLAADPATSRLVIKYCQRKKEVAVSLRTDKTVISHRLQDKTDIKKLEAVIARAAEVLTNKKTAELKHEQAPEHKADGKKNKKKGGKN